MNAWIEKVINTAKVLYQRAEELSQEEVGIPLSEETVNSLLERYVTKNVDQVQTLTAKLGTRDFHLNAHIIAKGINAKVSADFGVVSFEFNENIQRMIFTQKTPTHIDSLHFDAWYKQPLVSMALFVIRRVLGRDPLGFILEKLEVATVNEDLLYFDIGRYFDENSNVISRLKRFQITHAFIKNTRLYLKSRINLSGLFGKKNTLITDDDRPENYQPKPLPNHERLVFADVPADAN